MLNTNYFFFQKNTDGLKQITDDNGGVATVSVHISPHQLEKKRENDFVFNVNHLALCVHDS